MRKLLFFLLIVISVNAFAQHTCAPFGATVTGARLVCAGSPDTTTASAHGTAPFTYRWSPGGLTNATAILSPNVTTTYTLTVIDSCQDSIQVSFVIRVETPSLNACCGGTISAGQPDTLSADGPDMASYIWQPAVATCLNPPLCSEVIVTPTVTTSYTVTGTDSVGCQIDRILTITVSPAGIPSISASNFIHVYPNPSSTNFTINLQSKSIVSICDMTGRVLYTKMENAGTANFGNELSPGVYFLFVDGKPAAKLVKL